MDKKSCNCSILEKNKKIFSEEMLELLSKYQVGAGESLIAILQDIQDKFGYLSKDNLFQAAKYTNTAPSKVYGVATFYNQFRLKPPGKYLIQVCRGTACHVKGSKEILEKLKEVLNVEAGQSTEDGFFTLEEVMCIGACSIAPLIVIDNKFYGKMTTDRVEPLIEDFRKEHS